MPVKCKMQIFDADPAYFDRVWFKNPDAAGSVAACKKVPIPLCLGPRFKQYLDTGKADILYFYILKQQRYQPDLGLQFLYFDHLRLRAPGGVGKRCIRHHQRRRKTDLEVYVATQTQFAARGILNHSSNQRL